MTKWFDRAFRLYTAASFSALMAGAFSVVRGQWFLAAVFWVCAAGCLWAAKVDLGLAREYAALQEEIDRLQKETEERDDGRA